MSDFDFLKEFGKNLDRERPIEPSDTDWEKINAVLDRQEHSKRRRRLLLTWAFPLAASVALLLLGSLLWQNRLQTNAMQDEIARLQKELLIKDTIILTDTTIQHISFTQYDTVYRTVVIQTIDQRSIKQRFSQKDIQTGDFIAQTKYLQRAIKEQSKTFHIKSLQRGTQNVSIAGETPNTGKYLIQQKDSLLQKVSALNNSSDSLNSTFLDHNKAENIQTNISTFNQSLIGDSLALKHSLAALPLKNILPSSTHYMHRLPEIFDLMASAPIHKPPPASIIRRLRPHSGMVSVTAGLLFTQTDDAEPRNNYTLGLNGQIAFGRHWWVFAGLERGQTSFKVRGLDLDHFHLPAPPPPTQNDVMKYVEIKQPLWDFSLGLRYVFTPEKRLRPFIGAAWLGEQQQEQTLKYEFYNQFTKEESYVLVPRNDTRFNAHGLQIGLGAQWAFTKRLSFGLEGTYQWQDGPSAFLLGERWVLKTGLSYSF